MARDQNIADTDRMALEAMVELWWHAFRMQF